MGKLLIIAFILSFKSMAFDPLIIEEGIEAIANGVSSEIESPTCSESQNNIYDCSKYLNKYEKMKAQLVSLSTDPVSHGFSEIELTDAGNPKYFALKAKLRSRLSRLVQKCQIKRAQSCYGKGQAIDKKTLNQKFNSWKTNKVYRMPYPAVHCYQRAYLLSEQLKKEGYDVSLLQIGTSPTLIAKTLDEEDNLLDIDPIDYNGIHWVVSIKAKDESGKEKKLLLDPQFATRPMEYGEYFIKTIGQECGPSNFYEGTEFMVTRISSWKCGYREFNPARLWQVRVSIDEERKDETYGVSGETILRNESSCGFDYKEDAKKLINRAVGDYSFKVEDRNIKSIDDTKDNILSAYRNDYKWLKGNLDFLSTSIEQSKQRIKDYKKSKGEEIFFLDSEKESLKKKKKELKLVKKLIRDYEGIITNIEKNLGVK